MTGGRITHRFAAVVLVLILAGCGSQGVTTPTTGHTGDRSMSIGQLRAQYLTYRNAYETAQAQVVQTAKTISSDITTQEQRVQNDANIDGSNKFGIGCAGAINPNSPGAYPTCVNQEEQMATKAEGDEVTAKAQIAQDKTQLEATDRPFSGDINTFAQQLGAMPWPAGIKRSAEALVAGLVRERMDLTQEERALSDGNTVAGKDDSAKVTADESNVQRDTLALNGQMGKSSVDASGGFQ